MSRGVKSLIVVGIIFLFILGSGFILKNIILQQVKRQIQPSLGYSKVHLNLFPPTLIIEDARSVSSSPFFSARKISVRLSFQSVFSREKPLHVLIDNPVLRIDAPLSDEQNQEQQAFQINLPYSLERGWIRGGELYYWGKETRMQAKDINASFSQRREQFALLAESGNAFFYSITNPVPVEGRLSLFLEGRGKTIDIKKLKISSPAGVFRAQGTLIEPMNPRLNLTYSINMESDLIARLLKLPFEWQGRAAGRGNIVREGKGIHFDAGFSSRMIELNGVDMGRVDGTVDFSQETGGRVNVHIQRRGLPSERMEIRFKDKRVQGSAFGVHLDPVMRHLSLPWPVPSGAWGGFTLEKRRLSVDAEFRDEIRDRTAAGYPIHGRVRVGWDGRKGVTFSSEDLLTQFAAVGVEGVLHVGQSIDVLIRGDVTDVKEARRFTALILNKEFRFPEIRGAGEAALRIYGDFASPSVRGDFSLSPAGFDRFDVQTARGDVEIVRNEFTGNFDFVDPSAKGRVRVLSVPGRLKADIDMDNGALEAILPALNVSLPLKGMGAGRFELLDEDEILKLEGNFFSSALHFLGQSMDHVQGKISWSQDTLSLSDFRCRFHEGLVRGEALLSFADREFRLDVEGEDIDLSSIVPSMNGVLTLDLKGEGAFGQDYSSGRFTVTPLIFKPFQETEAKGEVKLGFTEEKIQVSLDGNFFPGENEFHVSLDIPLDEGMLWGDVRGFFTNFDLLIPWNGAEGRINYLGELQGPFHALEVKGGIDFQGSVFPFPKFAHALRDFSGLIFVENNTLTLRALQGKMGGGDIQGQGFIRLGKKGVETIDLEMGGKNLMLSPLERTRVLAEGHLNLIKDSSRFILDGDFYANRLSWQRELAERFVFYSTPYYQSHREPGFFDDLTLNIRLRADDNAWMENSLGRIRGRLDLTIAGNVRLPVVLGDIEAIDGYVFFQDRKFDILRGRVSFSNPLTIEPYLSFTGETYVKDYRVTFGLDGLLDKLTPEFSSSPPLPPEDVLALLALGESFRRTYSYDRSAQQSTASLVSFQLSEEAKKSADKLFRLDRFRIDPFVLGSSAEMTARLTLGKRISRNFFILYSTNLTTQREEITRIEWELTNDLSIVGTRDEKGRVSIDVKIHKRF